MRPKMFDSRGLPKHVSSFEVRELRYEIPSESPLARKRNFMINVRSDFGGEAQA